MILHRKLYSIRSTIKGTIDTVKDGFSSKSKLRDKYIDGESGYTEDLEDIHREARRNGGMSEELKDRYESLKESRQKERQLLENKLRDISKSRVRLAKAGALLTAGGLIYKGLHSLGSNLFKKKKK